MGFTRWLGLPTFRLSKSGRGRTMARTSPTPEASSVVEGVDYNWDTYDPDELRERGVVSGHEMAHVYGEENHPYPCKEDSPFETPEACNIMRRCKMPDRVSFWFTDGSKREIMFRYHYGSEHDSGYEGVPACP